MALETGTYINSLVASNPVSTDGIAQADDHMRLIKSTVKATFPSITGAVTADQTEINVLDGITSSTAELNILTGVTSTAAEINLLDGVTATTAEINYLSGVTGNIQTLLSGISTALVNDPTPTLAANLDTNGNAIAFGNWTIEVDGSNNLLFKYAGDTKIRMTAAGAFDVEDDITAFSGI